jgi:glycosyltransferase involved in cell wall biosynthesis
LSGVNLSDGRLGVLVSQLSIGGAERQTALLLAELARRHGIRPWVYVMSPRLDPFGPVVQQAGCEVRNWPHAGSYSLARALAIRRLARSRGVRVLHAVHYEAMAYGHVALMGLRRAQLLPSIRSTKIRPPALKRFIYRRALRSSRAVISNSHSGAEFMHDSFGVSRRGLHVIPNAIDLSVCKAMAPAAAVRAKLGIASDAPLVCFVGRDSGYKDLPLLYRIAASVLAEEPRAVFLLMGHGLDEDAVQRASGLDPRSVRGLGLRNDVYDILAASDALLLTSWTEGCPNVVLEAMALGVPPVATSVGDCPRIVEEERNGYLFTHGDAGRGAELLLRILRHPELRERLGREGARKVFEEYSVGAMVDRTVDVYHSLLSAGSA